MASGPTVRGVRPQDPTRVQRDVGRRIAELREKAGLTQDELAEILDHSVKYQQRLERGDENLSLDKLTKIANGLGARVIDLHKKPRDAAAQDGGDNSPPPGGSLERLASTAARTPRARRTTRVRRPGCAGARRALG